MPTEGPSPEFLSWRSYWNFARAVGREFRYIRSPEVEAFLSTVLATSAARKVELSKGRLFWRAQVGHDWRPVGDDSDDKIPSAYSRSRRKPLEGRAGEGRANPRGSPASI